MRAQCFFNRNLPIALKSLYSKRRLLQEKIDEFNLTRAIKFWTEYGENVKKNFMPCIFKLDAV
jgi:hypothetical protein